MWATPEIKLLSFRDASDLGRLVFAIFLFTVARVIVWVVGGGKGVKWQTPVKQNKQTSPCQNFRNHTLSKRLLGRIAWVLSYKRISKLVTPAGASRELIVLHRTSQICGAIVMFLWGILAGKSCTSLSCSFDTVLKQDTSEVLPTAVCELLTNYKMPQQSSSRTLSCDDLTLVRHNDVEFESPLIHTLDSRWVWSLVFRSSLIAFSRYNGVNSRITCMYAPEESCTSRNSELPTCNVRVHRNCCDDYKGQN